jgi:hypothetical protein
VLVSFEPLLPVLLLLPELLLSEPLLVLVVLSVPDEAPEDDVEEDPRLSFL